MIYGERVRLRSAEKSDLETFVRWLNDPEVYIYLNIFLPLSLANEQQWFEKMLTRPQEEQPLVIEVRQGEHEWRPIGNLGLHDVKWRERSAEFGIVIGEKAFWGHGYGSEAIKLLLQHAFDTLNLNRVFLRVYETNQRAIRVYEKIGFVHEGKMRQAEFIEGDYVDVLLMSILRAEWKGGL